MIDLISSFKAKIAVFLLAVSCLVGSQLPLDLFQDTTQLPSSKNRQVSALDSNPDGLGKIEIQDIKVGMRVPAENPEISAAENSKYREPDWTNWKSVKVLYRKPSGNTLTATMLKSPSWFEVNQPYVGGDIFLSIPEIGIEGPAEVLEISTGPKIKPGPGRVVVSTFHHSSAEVMDLVIGRSQISAETESIGVTTNHPFWSVDRQEFVQAGRLKKGEQLKTLDKQIRVVIDQLPRPGPQAVYNFEVHQQHVYFVGVQKLLAHNSGDDYFRSSNSSQKRTAFGLSTYYDDFLDEVADEFGVTPKRYQDEFRVEELNINVMESQLDHLMMETDHIDFNLTGMNKYFEGFDEVLEAGAEGPEYRNVTNWEAYHAYTEYSDKVTWWFRGEIIEDIDGFVFPD